MPVKGLAPIVAGFIVVGIVLIKICLRVQDILLPQQLRHAHIADAIREHPKDTFDHLGGFRIDDQVMAVIGILLIAEGRTAADEHPAPRSGPMRRLCLCGRLPRVEGVDDIGHGEYQIVQPLLGIDPLCYRDKPYPLFFKVVFNVQSHLRVLATEAR